MSLSFQVALRLPAPAKTDSLSFNIEAVCGSAHDVSCALIESFLRLRKRKGIFNQPLPDKSSDTAADVHRHQFRLRIEIFFSGDPEILFNHRFIKRIAKDVAESAAGLEKRGDFLPPGINHFKQPVNVFFN